MSLFSSAPFTAFVAASVFLGLAVWIDSGVPLLPMAVIIFSGMLAIPFAIIGTLNTIFGAQQKQ